jgi:hypothetical protein
LFGSTPKRILVANLEVVLASLGYRVSREPFQVVAFKPLGKKKRLHLKIETFGGSLVPKDAPIDLHIDILSVPMKYHKSIAFDERIAQEMEALEESISTSEWRARGGDSIANCPMCGKEMAGRFLANHIKVIHAGRKVRRG